MPAANSPSDRQAVLLDLHKRLLSLDPVAPEELFTITAPEIEKHLRARFPSLAPSVDPDIYLSAVYETLTDYFKAPEKYDPAKSGLMTYLRLACRRDLQNLLAKESRHASGRISLESVAFSLSDGNDISERVANNLDNQQLISDLMQGMTSEEQAVFSLVMEGERSTRVAAEAMNIGHLALEEQAKLVKRVKDRIKKRIRRRGLFR